MKKFHPPSFMLFKHLQMFATFTYRFYHVILTYVPVINFHDVLNVRLSRSLFISHIFNR